MKKWLLIRVLFLVSVFIICYSVCYPFDAGAPSGFCNAPANNGFTCKACHSGPSPIVLPGLLSSNIPPSGYVPGNTYIITASIARPGHIKFGFEVSPQDSLGALFGTIVITDTTTQLVGSGNEYITHTTAGTSGINNKSWSFNWIAPSVGTGSVQFYGAFLATNANGTSAGDTVLLSTLLMNENINSVSDNHHEFFIITVYPNPATSSITIEGATQSEKVRYSICNPIGAEIKSGEIISNGNSYSGKISLSDISSGIYYLKVTDGINSRTKKLNKQ